VDQLNLNDANAPARPVDENLVADDGRTATIRCVGPMAAGIGEQIITLQRPAKLTISRTCEKELTWWYAGNAQHQGTAFDWPDGTQLIITRGKIAAVNPQGYVESKKHYGGMKFADPHPFTYPSVTVAPHEGRIEIEVSSTTSKQRPE
jgi:hypothetical protein